MGESIVNKLCALDRRLCAICLAALVGSPAATATELPERIEEALLDEDWNTVIQRMDEVDVVGADVPCRMVAAHACLATNHGSEAARIVASLKDEDLQEWLRWTAVLVQENQTVGVAHYLRADALARVGQLDQAIQFLDQSINANDESGMAYVARGLLRTLQGGESLASGLLDLSAATERMPDCAFAWSGLAFHWIIIKTPGEAARCYAKAIDRDGTSGDAWLGRACARLGNGEFEAALHDLEEAVHVCPELLDLCSRNRSRIVAFVNRFLHDIEQYVVDGRPGVTMRSTFTVSEITVDGKVVPVYVVSPSSKYQETLANLKRVGDDLSQRWGKPVGDLHVHLHLHGWADSGYGQREFAAHMAAAGKKDAALALDVPELRGKVSMDATGLEPSWGNSLAAVTWKRISDMAALKLSHAGQAINEVFGSAPSLSADSGGAEAFVKQGIVRGIEVPRYDEVVLTAYPFHRIEKFRNVEVSKELADNTGRIVNLHTNFGHWSNILDGPSDKVSNVKLTVDGHGIPHGGWTSAELLGKPNPVTAISGGILQGVPTSEVRDLANAINEPRAAQTGNAALVDIRAPFFGWGPKTRAFGDLPDLQNYTYLGPDKRGEPVLSSARRTEAAYDRIVRSFPHLQAIGLMNDTIGLLGAVKGSKSPADTPGRMEGTGPVAHVFSFYQGANRLKLFADGTFGIYRFEPTKSADGRLFSTDPQHPANWRLMTKDDAINTIHGQASYQSKVKGRPDPTHAQLFQKLTGYQWQPTFSRLKPRDQEFSEILKKDMNEMVTLNLPYAKTHTTYDAFLKGDIPQNKQELALAGESAQTYVLRQIAGGNIGFRDWRQGRTVGAELKPTKAMTTWENIGATSFGKGSPLADVWSREFKYGQSVSQMVEDTLRQAKASGASDVVLVHNTTGRTIANEMANRLRARGLNVVMRGHDGLSKLTAVGSTMGLGLRNARKSAIAWLVDGGNVRIGGVASNDSDGGMSSRAAIERIASTSYLLTQRDGLEKIPSLVNSISQKMRTDAARIIGTGDLRSAVLAAQLQDKGHNVNRYDLFRALPDLALLSAVNRRQESTSSVAVEPRLFRFGDKLPDTDQRKFFFPPERDGLLLRGSATGENRFHRDPPDKFGGGALIPVLESAGFKRFQPPNPARFPGGVSTKEFAKMWVDNADWPVLISVPGWYGKPISLAKE